MDISDDSVNNREPQWSDSATQAMGDFVRGAFHSTVECPTNGVVQLANLGVTPLTGQKISRLDITKIEEDLKNGEANLIAVEAGSALGSAALFYAANKLGMGGKQTMSAAKMAEYGGLNSLKTSLLTSAKSGAMSGVVWGTVLTESRGGDDPYNVLLGRAANGIQYGFAFGSAAAASEASRSALSQNRLLGTASQGKFLTRELPLVATAGGLTGVGTGIVNANLETLIHEHRLATAGEMGHRALSEGLMGMSFAAAHQTHSHYTRFAPLQSGEMNKLKWIETTDLNTPALQKFYQQNQLPGLRQPFEVLATETKNFQLKTFDGYIDPISRHTTAHVTRFPNDRIAAISIDQKIHDNGPRLRWERRSLFVGQDVFAPELAGTKLPAEHIKLNQKRLSDWLVKDESNGGIRAEEFRNRATIRPLPGDGDVPLTQLDVEVRNAYGEIGGRQLDPKTFPFEVTFGRAAAEATPVRAEVVFNSFEHEYFPTTKLDCREGDQYYKAIKEIAHEMPSSDPRLSAAYAEFRKFNEYPSVRIGEQSPPRPTSTTQLQDFHNSPYSAILGKGKYGFAAGITFDANARHLRPVISSTKRN